MAPKRIILIEDDPDILFTVNMILENAGYKVTALSSAQTILRHEFESPDLFIIDRRMPDTDGLDVCRRLKADSATESIPVIIISASPKCQPLAHKAGANDFLEKPFQIKDLLRLVSKYISVVDLH
jgi:DNA-binding response OmpR family regulator